MAVPIQHILFTVFQSILQVFLLCLAGFILAFRGIVDKPASKVLNHINVALFTPALLFSKVAYFLSPAKLRQLWVIPIFFVVLSGLSALIAYSLARACRLKRSQVNFAIAASMFMNSNSLPVALMQSLVTTVPLLKWGPDDTVNAMFGRSLTYLVVFSTLGMILRWSYGVRLLSKVDEPNSRLPTTYHDEDDPHDPSAAPLVNYETEADMTPRDKRMWRTRALRTHPRSPLARRHSHPHSRLPAVPTSLGDQSENGDSDDLDTTEGDSEDTIVHRSEPLDTGYATETEDRAAPAPSPRWANPARPSLFKRLLTTLTSLSPPLIASLLALFCVLVPPIQRLLKSPELIPFTGALESAGKCSVPVTLLVLGGWFWGGEPKTRTKHKDPVESKAGPRGQANAKTKGKGVEKHYVTLQVPQHITSTNSRASSATSLSSMIGAFGDVLMGRMHPGRESVRAKRHARGSTADDLEPELLATPTEAEVNRAENGVAHEPRLRSQTDATHGRGRSPSPFLSSSSVPPSSVPALARNTNPPGETLTVVVTLLARMVVVPAVVIPLLILMSRLGWGGEVFQDPVFVVSSMLLVASPPALSLAQISQRSKTAATTGTETISTFERLLSRTIFWAYLVLTPPITIASVMVGLLLVGA